MAGASPRACYGAHALLNGSIPGLEHPSSLFCFFVRSLHRDRLHAKGKGRRASGMLERPAQELVVLLPAEVEVVGGDKEVAK